MPDEAPRLDPGIEGNIQRLLRSYKIAKRRIENELREASLTPAARFRAGRHLDEIQRTISALSAQAQAIAEQTIEPAYVHGQRLAEYSLRRQGQGIGKPVSLDAAIHREALEGLVTQMRTDIADAHEAWRAAAEGAIRQTQQIHVANARLEDEVAQGLISGQERRRVSRRLQRQLEQAIEDGSRVVVRNREGVTRHYDPEYYGELVARTMTREAVTEGELRTGRDLGQRLYRVSVHSGACEHCQEFQGKIFADGGEHDGFPQLEEAPPYHPNCAHVLTVFVPTGRSEEELDALRRISQDREGRIHDFDDYQRVRAGGALKREPREWDEESRTLKRQRRQREREGVTAEVLSPLTEETPRVSDHRTDERIRDLIAGAGGEPGDVSAIQAKAVGSDFLSGETLQKHLRKRVEKEGQWDASLTAQDYERDLKRVVRNPSSQVAVYERYGGRFVAFTAPTREVISEDRLGPNPEEYTAVIYSADRGTIVSGYQFSSFDTLDTGGKARWLR